MYVPENLVKQVEQMIIADTKKRERALQQKSIPYLEVILTGKDGDNYENFDKIEFPTYVTYEGYGVPREGIINYSATDGKYHFFDTTKQWSRSNNQGTFDKIEDLMTRFPFKVCKAKLILKRG